MAARRSDHPELTLRTCAAWRRWLQKNHARSRGVWFEHFREASGEKSVGYDDCVGEALCFGRIDCTIRSWTIGAMRICSHRAPITPTGRN